MGRSDEIAQRTANANRNLLRLHTATRQLWQSVVAKEREEGFEYDWVIFARDDSLWLEPFSLRPFMERTEADIFMPSCDARKLPMHPLEINDHILISRRSTADLFGDYYSKLFEMDSKGCIGQLSDKVTKNGKRGCNSEMLLKWFLEKEGARVGRVGQGLVPFQRSVNLLKPDGSREFCFHKFCQSKENPLLLRPNRTDYEMCSKWSSAQTAQTAPEPQKSEQ